MAGEFNAGSVLVELKAQYADLKKNVSGAKAEMTGFGERVDATAKSVESSGKKISGSFEDIDAKGVRMAARLIRVTGALFALNSLMTQFSSQGPQGGVSQFSEGMKAASTGLSTFATIALAIPHPVGIAIGAFAGLTAGLVSYGRAMGLALEATDAIQKKLLEMKEHKLTVGAEDLLISSTLGGGARDSARLQLQIRELEASLKRNIVELDRLKADNARGVLGQGDTTTQDQLDAIFRFQKGVDDQTRALLDKRRAQALAEGRKDREALAVESKLSLEQTQALIVAGLVDPLQLVQAQATAADSALKLLFQQQVDLEKIAPGLGAALGTDISTAIARAKATDADLKSANIVKHQADEFGDAIGRALSDAILNARKPMEALANVGRGLFENMVNDLAKNLQTQLSAAFKAIAGGSDVLGGALTAALGIGGAVLSRLGNKSESSFGNIQSAITSSQEVRGVIAGPSSVAIASVGQNLQRAMEPVVTRLDIIGEILISIESNTRGGRGAGGGPSSGAPAVATASDFA